MATNVMSKLLRGTTTGVNKRFPGDNLSGDQITRGQENNIFHVAAKYHESWSPQLDLILKDHRSLVHDKNKKGDNPLHIMARLGKSEFAKSLVAKVKELELEANCTLLQKKNKKGNTALHEAVQNGHYHMTEFLIKEDPTLACSVNNAGESPLFLALDGEYHKIALTILETPNCCSLETPHDCSSGRNGMTVMHAAVIRARRELIAEDNKPLHSQSDGIIKHGDYFVGKVLTKWGLDILVKPDEIGWMPHHYAANMGKSKILKSFLTEKSSLAYETDKGDMSALHISARNGHIDVIKTLIEECPDVCELLDKKYRTALHVAVEHQQANVVRTMLNTKAFNDLLNEQDEDGNTALHLACIHGNYAIIKYFFEDRRINKRTINKKEMTARDIINRSSKLDPFEKALIESKYPRDQGSLLSLQGAATAMNQKTKEHQTTPTNDSEMSQPKDEKPIRKDSKEAEVESNNSAMSQSKDDAPVKVAREVARISSISEIFAELNTFVASIVASITFAAALAMPGGYDSSTGLAVLRKKTSFRNFLVFDSLGFGLATASLFVAFVLGMLKKYSLLPILLTSLEKYLPLSILLSYFSIISSLFAFALATKAVLYEKDANFFEGDMGFPGNTALYTFFAIILSLVVVLWRAKKIFVIVLYQVRKFFKSLIGVK